MTARTLDVLIVASLVACGGAQPGAPTSAATPRNFPDLSAPSRFRPSIVGLEASSLTIKVGETSVITARVTGARRGSFSWTVALDPSSSANGTLSDTCGAGDVRVSFTANYRGNAVIEVNATDSYGVPAITQSVTITVEP